MKNLLIITVLFVLSFVTSCKKDEVAVVTKTKKEIISSKTWIANEVVVLGAVIAYKRGNKPADNLLDLDKVSLKFNTDGTLTGLDNTGKALSGAKWTISTDETKITISGVGVVGIDGDKTIVQATDTNFDLSGLVPYSGQNVTATIKAVPQ
jgi:hypothetical protein